MKADLHIHTTKSDGSKTPTEVVRRAKSKGLELIAITDHDGVAGLEEGREEANRLGIKFVDGIELSTFATCEIHILGYNFDYKNPDFLAELQAVKEMRKERNRNIGKKLESLGIKTDIDFSADGLGRMNMARALVKTGYCTDTQDAFDRYLGVNGRAYCDARRLTPVEAVKLIKRYGGIASVAHPKKYLLDKRLDLLLGGLKQYGLDGLELNYPSHNESDKAQFEELMKKYGLIATGGSDYHGDEDKNFFFTPDVRTLKKLRVIK